MNKIVTIIIGIALYAVFRMVRVFLLNPGKLRWAKMGTILTAVELVVWILYFFWAVDQFFLRKSYYDFLFVGLIFLFVFLLAWFYVKDLVAGAFFKIQYSPKTGKHLQSEHAEGTIKIIGATHLTLESADGEWIRIPFSRLQGSIITQGNRKEHTGDFRIRLHINKTVAKDDAVRRIRQSILQSPFCSFKKPIEVRQVEETPDSRLYEVTISTIGTTFLSRIERQLKEDLQVGGEGNVIN